MYSWDFYKEINAITQIHLSGIIPLHHNVVDLRADANNGKEHGHMNTQLIRQHGTQDSLTLEMIIQTTSRIIHCERIQLSVE